MIHHITLSFDLFFFFFIFILILLIILYISLLSNSAAWNLSFGGVYIERTCT